MVSEVAVWAIKSEPKCKLCRHPQRHLIDDLLEQRSMRQINGERVLEILGTWGVTNPTLLNIKGHWKNHCQTKNPDETAPTSDELFSSFPKEYGWGAITKEEIEKSKAWKESLLEKSNGIYLVGAARLRPIKVGYTDGTVRERLASIQTGNPDLLGVFAFFPSDRSQETVLHRILWNYHIRGEWFDRRILDFETILHRTVELLNSRSERTAEVACPRSKFNTLPGR